MMLDAVVDYMPSPLDIPPIKGIDPETGEEDVRHTSDTEPVSYTHLERRTGTGGSLGISCQEKRLVHFHPCI